MIRKDKTPIGFIGLGTMGQPMALNLLRSGRPLVVWNRSQEKSRILERSGAQVAANPTDVFGRARTVFLMLSTESAIDAVLGRHTARFASMVAGHVVVNTGTPSSAYSEELSHDLRLAGARYVEAPVLGQRGPAESGQLVAMLAGDDEDLEVVKPLLNTMCCDIILCGAVPKAVATKAASNVFVATMIAALAEAVNYARHADVDLKAFQQLIMTGPMASPLIRMKLPNLIKHDSAAQALRETEIATAQLIKDSAMEKGIAVPLLARSVALQDEVTSLGTRVISRPRY
ncbi:NAD(P)-dependent oxidoreductase (plasmid) [Agrobacterium sp. 33MFTa1.1]|uniref:NAD(P)-dependent oxidoreductase n=1 Tax=Agrobacterium sp. 33MFTa1.1 TaxID=1279031 RepID=UPI00068FD768|nr:NAD(P)-dependent oxidoreductase [Agrobacterium sp. 33MFTa1.1]QBJ16485.1 NAD(P)-dependent oxidoreductase [Agrobacterium sp. 33MFTa1.1]